MAMALAMARRNFMKHEKKRVQYPDNDVAKKVKDVIEQIHHVVKKDHRRV